MVYENEEFNLLQSALNIEEGLENLRYNYVVVATDADVDGMHIRLLLLTFFLQFYPDLVRNGHLYILQTPLVQGQEQAEDNLLLLRGGKGQPWKNWVANPEITRFKGLGEISPDEFRHFIGKNMRLDPVILDKGILHTMNVLTFYMGKNTPERQNFIIDNLKMEEDPSRTLINPDHLSLQRPEMG